MPPKKKGPPLTSDSKKSQGLLQEIESFNKSRLKKRIHLNDAKNNDEQDIYESDNANMHKTSLKQETLDQKLLCYNFWNGKSYPIHKLKFIVQRIPARAEVTLNFAGISQLTDVAFAVMANLRKAEEARFKAVERIILDGCHLITDTGLSWMGETFSELKWLSIVGCNKVTDAGLISLNKLCPFLVSIDVSGTSVNFLPKRWIDAEGMRMIGCPILFPLPPVNIKSKDPLKNDKQHLIKIGIVKRDNSLMSILAVMKGEKQPSKPLWPQVCSDIAVSGDVTAVVMEFDQALSSLMVTNHSLVIIPSDLKDQTKIHEEAASISGLILEILGKHSNTQFLIVGCKTDVTCVVPIDLIKEEVEKCLKKNADLIKDSTYSLASLEQMSVTKQLEYSLARRLFQNINSTEICVAEINLKSVEKNELLKAIENLAQKLEILSEINYSQKIYTWAKKFHSICPKVLQAGIHTLSQAAVTISENSDIKERLRPFGAVHFLVNLGNLILWKSKYGEILVANSSWLCKCLRLLTSPDVDGVANNGRDPTIADEAKVWPLDKLQEEAKDKHLDWVQVEAVMKKVPFLFLSSGSCITTFSNLPENCVMPTQSFTDFDKNSDEEGIHLVYSFVLNQNISSAVIQEILAGVLQLHRPICIWKSGVILYDSIVAVMVGQTGYSKVLNLAAYMTSTPANKKSQHESNAKLIYSTIDKYRVVVTYVLMSFGIMWEQLCSASTSIQQPPEGITGVVHSHSLRPGEPGVCILCGMTSSQTSILSAYSMALNPAFMSEASVKSLHFEGSVNGSLVEVTGPCEVKVQAWLDPLDCRQCSVLLMQGNVRHLKISFVSPGGKSICVDLNEQKILTTVNMETSMQDISGYLGILSLQGEEINAIIKEDNPMKIELYIGPRLMHTAMMPYDKYGLTISSRNFTDESNSAMWTVRSTNFKFTKAVVEKDMRLEAVDRMNPHLICVATIADIKPEDDTVLIHFDGWTERYDYWTNFSHKDLHPIGYMKYRGTELAASQYINIRPELQIPSGYHKEFDWATYMKEVEAEPVPYQCFNEEQTEEIPEDEINRVENELGTVFQDSQDSLSQACRHSPMRASYIEHKVVQHLTKTGEVIQHHEQELSMRKHILCFLPPALSVQFLRFPLLKMVYSNQKQNLHCLCPGQVLDLHHVNHPGLPMETWHHSDWKEWVGALMPIYTHLLLQKNTLPSMKDSFCEGADNIPADKEHRLEAAMKRLYKLYLMHGLYFWGAQQEMSVQQNDIVEKILRAAWKSNLGQQFSSVPGTTSVLCHAHRQANSPSMGLQEISIEKFQSMTNNIYVIHLENNPLSTLPEQFFSLFINLTQLWLNGCCIQELPASLKNNCLEELHLKGNFLTTLPDDMKELSMLKILDISHNPLEVLPPVISHLVSLVELYAENIGHVNLNIITPLTSLTVLSVGQNYIDAIPDQMPELSLTVLDMSGLPFMSSGSSFSISQMDTFLDKYTVYKRLTEKDRQEFRQMIDNLGEQSNNTAKVAEFNRILFEKYPRIGQTKSQTESVIPEAIVNIRTLERLVLSYHAFVIVPDTVQNLTHLEYLNIGHNPRLESVSAHLAILPLKELHLQDCMNLKTPPKEVVRRGFLAVMGFLKRLLQGSVSCKRTKLMMVGLGGAGKTSLVRALTNTHHNFYEDYGEKITDGIDITEWTVGSDLLNADGFVTNTEEGNEPLHFSVWDFAGQTVYYNTHQFFLSNRAVYILLWNIRLGFEHAGLDFWLSSIACHAPKAPILVVGTHCDKVEKGKLPMEELKRRFQQIVGFYFISSYSGEGIDQLKRAVIASALAQKYMGERIPEAWLSLEKRLDKIRPEKPLLPWTEVEEIAGTAGIFDHLELVEAVQFLHDLGSVQFFNTSLLRSQVVIVPQWIVDVMACIVTVHDGPTKDGKLLYSDMKIVWHNYPEELHPWLLQLTEEFDLTFPLANEEANIVPCLLTNTEPQFDFPLVDKEKDERESKMIYKFDYLPAGLFSRTQVRLHQFSDCSFMWKKGFMLRKNNHRALLLQTSNTEVVVTARGYKPENLLFLIHEVFECLIADSYMGVAYDYSIPCTECASEYMLEPCMFPASKVRRAFDMKAPFLQCDKNFHIVSISEIQSHMPPDYSTDLDDHLSHSVRELKDLEQTVAIHVLFIYTRRNIPDLANIEKVVDPAQVLEDLRSSEFNVFYCDNPETANMESLIISIKSAQVVIFGISDEFVESAECRNLIIYTKQTLHKAFVLLAIGKTLNWMKTDINLVLSDEVFVKMIEIERYSTKLPELVNTIKSRGQKKKVDYPECFISYCWANSKTAVDLGSASVEGALGWADPRKIKEFLQTHNIKCWLDMEQMGQEGFFEDIADGLRKAKVMVACVSDEYANSKNCRMEFRFAVSTLKMPTILAVVGTGYSWERSEIGLLTVGHSHHCPKINLQYENEAGMLDLLEVVQNFLPKVSNSEDGIESESLVSKQVIAFQEILELTQRKLLRHISMYSDNMGMEPYPRLILIDLKIEDKEITEYKQSHARSDSEGDNNRDREEDRKREAVVEDTFPEGKQKSDQYCFRVLCENEQGWHETPQPISFPAKVGAATHDEFLKSVSPYAARILAVLTHSKLNLPILTTPQGHHLHKMMEKMCTKSTSDFHSEYKIMLQAVLEEDEKRTYGGLKRCHLPNGKILWLCDQHEKSSCTQTDNKFKSQLQQSEVDVAMESSTAEAEADPSLPASVGEEQTDETDETSAASFRSKEQVVVKLAAPAGGPVLPRRPKLTRRTTSNKKTTSQACRLM